MGLRADRTLSKEDLLIRVFSRTDLGPSGETTAKALLSTDLDWNGIIASASRDGVAPLLHLHLKRSAALFAIDPEACAAFENLYYKSFLTNMEIAERVKTVFAGFASRSIEAIGLKGVFLSEQIYKNPALRPGADIDILIHRDDLAAAHEVLSSLGYRAPKAYADFLQARRVMSLNSLVYEEERPGDSLIHLHWHIINCSWPVNTLVEKIDMQRLWERSVLMDFAGTRVRVLNPTHSLIYLCHHGLNHYLDRLILACDINELIGRYGSELDWDEVYTESKTFGLHMILCCALETVSGLLAIEIPSLQRMESHLSPRERRIVSFFAKRQCDYAPSYLTYMLTEEGLLKKIIFLGRTIAPTPLAMAHCFSVELADVKLRDYFLRIVQKVF